MSESSTALPTAAPLSLPRLSPEAAAAANRFFAGEAVFRSGDRTWRISARKARPPARWELALALEVAGHQAALYCSSPIMALWEGCALDAREFAALPEELRAAAVEARLDALIRDFTAWTGQPVDLQSCSLEAEASWLADDAVPLRLERDDGLAVYAALHAAPEGLAFLADLFRSVAGPGEETVPRGAMPVTARIELTGPGLSPGECAGLARGDIILTRTGTSGENGLPAVLRIGPIILPAAWTPGRLTLEAGGEFMTRDDWREAAPDGEEEQRIRSGGLAPDEDAEAAAGPAAGEEPGVRVDDLPLPVRFELGELSLTVEELARLTAGQVFTLAAPASAPVRITLSGRRLGTGSLVEVGGRIGVRVEELCVETREKGHAAI